MFCDSYFKALVSFVLHAINKLRSLQARRVGIFSLYVHINIMKVPRRGGFAKIIKTHACDVTIQLRINVCCQSA